MGQNEGALSFASVNHDFLRKSRGLPLKGVDDGLNAGNMCTCLLVDDTCTCDPVPGSGSSSSSASSSSKAGSSSSSASSSSASGNAPSKLQGTAEKEACRRFAKRERSSSGSHSGLRAPFRNAVIPFQGARNTARNLCLPTMTGESRAVPELRFQKSRAMTEKELQGEYWWWSSHREHRPDAWGWLPSRPHLVYKDLGWISWANWIGQNTAPGVAFGAHIDGSLPTFLPWPEKKVGRDAFFPTYPKVGDRGALALAPQVSARKKKKVKYKEDDEDDADDADADDSSRKSGTARMTAPGLANEVENCPICLLPLAGASGVSYLPCDHYFCGKFTAYFHTPNPAHCIRHTAYSSTAAQQHSSTAAQPLNHTRCFVPHAL